ncbi:Alpha/Beta hydrolase protein [Cercophora newfieldiana]|uniref:Alpha/Beta hydrolase protein n=1 Tax=Cercophora newfieldiana TaxID=92897 RepID=A0AA40CQI4_9PEZI|nr:Alpha/Beta hydrolase protein [Cercophora newfieldiana]
MHATERTLTVDNFLVFKTASFRGLFREDIECSHAIHNTGEDLRGVTGHRRLPRFLFPLPPTVSDNMSSTSTLTYPTTGKMGKSSEKGTMILGPVSYLDCLVFCILLAPNLLWYVGLTDTLVCVLKALPFLLFELPVSFVWERYLCRPEERSLFVQKATPFEDFVIRCVRYAFANVPPRIGRVFFSETVARPFLQFRLLRRGFLKSPICWAKYEDVREKGFKGVWVTRDPASKPDVVIYYVHGGGFLMGSSYFYLEFLMTWLSVLAQSGYNNPAIFALEYTLVPDASYPTQIEEVLASYAYVLDVAGDPTIVTVSGDSAGAMLVLGLLLHNNARKPALALLISPWVTLTPASEGNGEARQRLQRNLLKSDYLDIPQLSRYGKQLAGSKISVNDPLVSPGCCKDRAWWKRAGPERGIFLTYGAEEVLAPQIEDLLEILKGAGITVDSKREPGGIHAWPVASLFLSGEESKRLSGLRAMTQKIREEIPSR